MPQAIFNKPAKAPRVLAAQGAWRVALGTVLEGDDSERKGLLVQEYLPVDGDDGKPWSWQTTCTLADAYFMLENCPQSWAQASSKIGAMIVRGHDVRLLDEVRELRSATGAARLQ